MKNAQTEAMRIIGHRGAAAVAPEKHAGLI